MHMNNIFVYGTLKRGLGNNHFVAGQKFIGVAETSPDFRLFDGGAFPAMVEFPDTGVKVVGELWSVSDSCKRRVDGLEGIPHMYKRIPVTLVSHPDLDVETYVMHEAPRGWEDCGISWSRRKTW